MSFMPRQRASTAASRLKVLDLFAGAGGLSLGFKQAGFTITAAVEMWEPAVLTYRRNHPGVALFHEDIREESLKQRILAIHETLPIDVVIGGPPCQGYSNAGNRDPLDPRGRLYVDFFAIIKALQPKVFVMENVKGLTSMRALPAHLPLPEQDQIKAGLAAIRRYKDLKRYNAQRELSHEEAEDYEKVKRIATKSNDDIKGKLFPLLPEILNIARDAGYVVKHEVLNARDHGSPQARERVFIVGIRKDIDVEFSFPEPGGTSRSVKDAIGDLEGKEEGCLPNHDFTRHSPAFVKRLALVKPGETVYKHYSDAWYRLVSDKPARTVKENHGGVFVHYAENRVLTPRELARLQDFPDDFVFEGPKSMVLKQIGNAVPVNLARSLALSIRNVILSVTSTNF